jgi:AAA family ATP:ADP antiporter
LIHPFIMIGTTILNFLVPGYMSSAVSQGLSRVTYDTVDLSARKSFQAMVPNEKRGRVSMFIDSYLPSAGTIIGSLIAFVIISIGLRLGIAREQYTLIYIGLGVLIAFVALFAAFKVRSTYEQSMLNWQLKRRTRGASVLDKLDFGGDDK